MAIGAIKNFLRINTRLRFKTNAKSRTEELKTFLNEIHSYRSHLFLAVYPCDPFYISYFEAW